jgi:hypothetical protein
MDKNMNVYEPDQDTLTNDLPVFRGWLKGVLTVQPATITFTKKDGTERVMNCTLRSDMLPAVEIKEDATPRKQNDSVISAYDLDAKGWRSFTVSAVKRVSFAIDDD